MTEEFSRLANAGASIAGGLAVGGGAAAVGAGLGLLGVAGAGASAFFWPVALPVAGIIYLFTESGTGNSIRDEIEGAGLFTFAKLSSAEMDKAKIDAGKIMAEIERNIKARNAAQQNRQ